MFHVDAGSMTVSHTMNGGHKGCVWEFVVSVETTGDTRSQQRVMLTGGEDARLCEWYLDGQQQLLLQHISQPTASARLSPSSRSVGRGRVAGAGAGAGARGGGRTKHLKKKNTCAPY